MSALRPIQNVSLIVPKLIDHLNPALQRQGRRRAQRAEKEEALEAASQTIGAPVAHCLAEVTHDSSDGEAWTGTELRVDTDGAT